ncbi:GNAT family N-acetyltransferase [Cryobacterium algoritolerans]|nr:GNAT family N-acetyltransferase [Cryobacterium algoritolerans]
MPRSIRPLLPHDSAQVLLLNNDAVPAVNALDEASLAALLAECAVAVVVTTDAEPAQVLGFAIVFAADADYASENYRWFAERSREFLYVDRIVVAEEARGQGLGEVLYGTIFASAETTAAVVVFCEVNIEPPNPGSLAFHSRLGFAQIGQRSTKNDTVVVALLAASVGEYAER